MTSTLIEQTMETTKHTNIGGSILPSSCPEILQPIESAFGVLQVRPLPNEDTHALFLTTPKGEVRLAEHPNGYSCHNLAERLIKGDRKRINAQAEYIVDCGGRVFPELQCMIGKKRCE